jgi:hypothetical protein
MFGLKFRMQGLNCIH